MHPSYRADRDRIRGGYPDDGYDGQRGNYLGRRDHPRVLPHWAHESVVGHNSKTSSGDSALKPDRSRQRQPHQHSKPGVDYEDDAYSYGEAAGLHLVWTRLQQSPRYRPLAGSEHHGTDRDHVRGRVEQGRYRNRGPPTITRSGIDHCVRGRRCQHGCGAAVDVSVEVRPTGNFSSGPLGDGTHYSDDPRQRKGKHNGRSEAPYRQQIAVCDRFRALVQRAAQPLDATGKGRIRNTQGAQRKGQLDIRTADRVPEQRRGDSGRQVHRQDQRDRNRR
ncbi:MAG TPA: hypothetical protein VJ851_02260 [Jatrophihabitans sp.]|nr:hypothetical protein [Jatrophihabitans sp.]